MEPKLQTEFGFTEIYVSIYLLLYLFISLLGAVVPFSKF